MDTKSQTDNLKNAAQDVMDDLRETGEDIQNRLGDYWETGREKATACMRATDRTIRDNPYQAAGIAFGLGVLIGLLLTRGGSSED